MNSAKGFARDLSGLTDKVESRVKALIAKPTPNNIHDIRTSIRRIEASFNLLPKNVRKTKSVSAYLARAKSLFKTTSSIRDIDIVALHLKKYETITWIQELLKKNEHKRSQLLVAATRSARLFEKTPAPNVKASQISESKLAKRRKKLEKKFEKILRDQTSTMLFSPKPEQLHEFRKSCKMLRYTLEFESNKKRKKPLASLENLQTILGSMMDGYITLEHLSQASLGEAASQIIDQLNAAKDKDYAKFAAILKRRFEVEPAKHSQKSNKDA